MNQARIVKSLACAAVALSLASCSTPGSGLKPVAAGDRSAAFRFKMKGCWGINVGCHGVKSLEVRDATTARLLWTVDLPNLKSGWIDYGRLPGPDQMQHLKLSSPDRSPHTWIPHPPPLPVGKPLVAIMDYGYDGPFPSSSMDRVFFQIDRDGKVTRFKDPKLRALFIQRLAKVSEEETKQARAAGRSP